jgi:hypothetical protein
MELPGRLLAGPPARLLNTDGGPGTYAAPLASRGYRVHLVDPLPLHVEQARHAGRPRSRLRLHRPYITRSAACKHVSAETACEIMHKALPRKRRGRGCQRRNDP